MSRLPPPAGPSGPPPPLPPGLRSRAGVLPGPPPLELPPARRPRRWWYSAAIALGVYLLLALFTMVQPIGIAGVSLTVPIPGLPPERIFGLPDRPFTVAIIGIDIRPTEEGPARTDSILLLRVDGARNRAGIVSIPRDSLMQIPMADGSLVQDRINTAFVYNWASDDESAAPAALARTIEHNLGVQVDYHVVFDQRDSAKVIDAAGGVTVSVGEAFGQENYSDDDVNVVPQYFPGGKQHLNGYEAVAYGRIREGSSDFDRIRRQQQVAEGLVSQLSSPINLWRLPRVWGAYRGAVDSDLNLRQSTGLLVLLKRIGTGRIVTRSLGDAAVSCTWCTASILLLDPQETSRLISEAFGDSGAGERAAGLLLAAGVTP